MTQLKDITQISIQINPTVRTDVSQLLQNLLSKLQSLEKYEEQMEKLNGADEVDSKRSSSANGLQQQISVHSNHSHKSSSSSNGSIVSTLLHPNDISEVCSSSLQLAHQLTHIELERLSHIGPEEFVQAFTKEHPSIESSFKDLKKTRNLEFYVAWFNRLSYLVATDVIKVSCCVKNTDRHFNSSVDDTSSSTVDFEVYFDSLWWTFEYLILTSSLLCVYFYFHLQHPKKKQRARIIEFWIETARESFNIGNFNSLMAIIAGLNMSPISRLKKTVRDILITHRQNETFVKVFQPIIYIYISFLHLQWAKIQSAKFSILEHQMDSSSNFSSYRSTLKAAMWRSAGATDERERIVIPFFSLLVKDLYFLNEGCSNKWVNLLFLNPNEIPLTLIFASLFQTAKLTHQLRKVLATRKTSHRVHQLEASDVPVREERQAHPLSSNDEHSQREYAIDRFVRVRAAG